MLLNRFIVAAFFALGSVTALPGSDADNFEVAARDLEGAEVEARGLDDAELEARDLEGDEGHLVARSRRRRCRHGYKYFGHKCCGWRHGRRHCYRY